MGQILTRGNLEIFANNTPQFEDRRKKMALAVFSYFDKDGNEFRRKFTAPPFTCESELWKLAPETIELGKNYKNSLL